MKLCDLIEGEVIDKSTAFRMKRIKNANTQAQKKREADHDDAIAGQDSEKIGEIKKSINNLVDQRGEAMIKHVISKYGPAAKVGQVLDMLDKDDAIHQKLKQIADLDKSGKLKSAAREAAESKISSMFRASIKLRAVK